MKKGISLFEVFGLGIMIGASICFLSYWWMGTMSMSIVIGIIISGVGITLIMGTRKFFKKEGKNGS